MTISVVQSKVFSGLSGSLNSAVTAGNTLLVLPYNYNSTNMSSSAPVYNGSTPSGSAKLTDVNAPIGTGIRHFVTLQRTHREAYRIESGSLWSGQLASRTATVPVRARSNVGPGDGHA